MSELSEKDKHDMVWELCGILAKLKDKSKVKLKVLDVAEHLIEKGYRRQK